MNAYDLPVSLTIGGREYPIRYGWRHVVKILTACTDPKVSDRAKTTIMLKILFPDWKDIPRRNVQEAIEKACEFIDCGQRDDGKPKPKMIDWGQDASLIIPEINKVANQEIRLSPDIHWWTFFGWFMGIGDGLFASILHIRGKKARRKKLEKWEEDFYKENRALCDLKAESSDEIQAEKDNMLKYL